MTRDQIVSMAALAACGVLATAMTAQAAPMLYQSEVTGDTPYVYYRFGEVPVANNGQVTDSSGNSRHGTYYVGSAGPVATTSGTGTATDPAVSFPGTGTGATGSYVGSPIRNFGTSVGASSYEFLYKTNAGFDPLNRQSLFGVFDPSTAPTDVEVTLNSLGNDATDSDPNTAGNQGWANTTRLYITGADNDAIGVHFTNPTLYDGNYHHLVFTFDRSTMQWTDPDGEGPLGPVPSGGFAAYVDGEPQQLTFQVVRNTTTSSGTITADPDALPDGFSAFDFDPTLAARNVRSATLPATAVQRLANVTLDEAALYNRVLSAGEVLAHAQAAGTYVPEPGSLALVGAAALGMLRRRRNA